MQCILGWRGSEAVSSVVSGRRAGLWKCNGPVQALFISKKICLLFQRNVFTAVLDLVAVAIRWLGGYTSGWMSV